MFATNITRIRKLDFMQNRIHAFESTKYRKTSRVSWNQKKSNKRVITIKPEHWKKRYSQPYRQVAQLSQRDRAARGVSYGQKWKNGTGRQYLVRSQAIFHADSIGRIHECCGRACGRIHITLTSVKCFQFLFLCLTWRQLHYWQSMI